MTVILDPTAERTPVRRRLTPVPAGEIRSLAFLDISKPKGSILLDRLQDRLQGEIPDLRIARYTKPAFSKPAPQDLRSRIARNHQMVLLALAD